MASFRCLHAYSFLLPILSHLPSSDKLRKNSHEYKQYHRCSCCSSEIMVNKCSSVCIGINNLCAVQRSTFGHQPDGVKTGHNTDQVTKWLEIARGSLMIGSVILQKHCQRLAPSYFCTLIHIPGNSLQCSQNKDHLKWNSLPDCHQDYTPER